jgi:hypothetical protein
VVLLDQATKAVQPTGAFIVNTGGAAILPSALGDALWKSPTLGAACDTLDSVLLAVALQFTRGLRTTRSRVGAIAVLAGLLSNLADRLGASSLFHAGLPRGSIDWIPVPLWPAARTNLADVAIALGALVLGHQALRKAALAAGTWHKIRPRLRVPAPSTQTSEPARSLAVVVRLKSNTRNASTEAQPATGRLLGDPYPVGDFR